MIISTDWYQQPCPKVYLNISYCPEGITFSGKIPLAPSSHPIGNSGEYTEGLWEQDVAELFISNPLNGYYIEVNIAANEAWWLMLFDSPRHRKEKFNQEEIKLSLSTKQQIEQWDFILKLPKALLSSLLGETSYDYNACFILNGSSRQYLTLNPLASKQPDFHRPQDFIAL